MKLKFGLIVEKRVYILIEQIYCTHKQMQQLLKLNEGKNSFVTPQNYWLYVTLEG